MKVLPVSNTLKYRLTIHNYTGDYLSEARDTFAGEAVFFQSREDFDDYMKTVENNFYETVNLPKSPYQTLTTNKG